MSQAQALIIYYESKKDLKKLDDLIKIYLGVPLKFYYGNKRYDYQDLKETQHFFEY